MRKLVSKMRKLVSKKLQSIWGLSTSSHCLKDRRNKEAKKPLGTPVLLGSHHVSQSFSLLQICMFSLFSKKSVFYNNISSHKQLGQQSTAAQLKHSVGEGYRQRQQQNFCTIQRERQSEERASSVGNAASLQLACTNRGLYLSRNSVHKPCWPRKEALQVFQPQSTADYRERASQ